MGKLLLIPLFLLYSGVLFSQSVETEQPFIYIDYEKKEIAINEVVLHANSLFSEYVEALGTYDRLLETYRYNRFYFDHIGMTILLDKKLETIEAINFQYIPILGQQGTTKAFQGNALLNGQNLLSFRSIQDVTGAFPDIEFRKVQDVLITTLFSDFHLELVFTQDNELEVCTVRFY